MFLFRQHTVTSQWFDYKTPFILETTLTWKHTIVLLSQWIIFVLLQRDVLRHHIIHVIFGAFLSFF